MLGQGQISSAFVERVASASLFVRSSPRISEGKNTVYYDSRSQKAYPLIHLSFKHLYLELSIQGFCAISRWFIMETDTNTISY